MKNLTKYLLLASLLLISSCNNTTQKKDSAKASSLKSEKLHPLRNGFSIFTLGSNIKDYSKSVKLIKEGFHKASYEVTDSNLLTINKDLKVDAITLNTWDGYIELIDVTVLDPYKEKFLDLLIGAYGNKKKEKGKLLYAWYFKDAPRLFVTYKLNDYEYKNGSPKARARFIRSIGKTEPNEEQVDKAKSNINDI
ncbi:MAG: hypothetical protein ACQPRH_04160 [Solitalea-like symbiont of Tyrophagus putrescentiae]